MVLFLEYKKKQYPFSIGYYALKHTNQEMKQTGKAELNMDSLMSTDLEVLEPLLFYSLVMGARLEDQELDLKREEMEFMLNECLFQFTNSMSEFFPEAPTGGSGEGKK